MPLYIESMHAILLPQRRAGAGAVIVDKNDFAPAEPSIYGMMLGACHYDTNTTSIFIVALAARCVIYSSSSPSARRSRCQLEVIGAADHDASRSAMSVEESERSAEDDYFSPLHGHDVGPHFHFIAPIFYDVGQQLRTVSCSYKQERQLDFRPNAYLANSPKVDRLSVTRQRNARRSCLCHHTPPFNRIAIISIGLHRLIFHGL